jgi:predicted metalloprotease with PDZ domain
MMKIARAAASFLLIALSAVAASQAAGPITITVDATDAPRNLFHAKLVIPASPGPLSLLYPEWIPGEHQPNGPINDLAGLKFTANGQTLAWRRDDVSMFTFHIEVPQGASSVEVSLDFLGPASEQGFSSSASATARLLVISWNQLLLYPAGINPHDLTYVPRLALPQGWKYASALEKTGQNGNTVEFRPVPLNSLIDSPVISGAHFKVVALAPEITPPHRIDMAADSEAALNMSASQLAGYNQMVRETQALFGTRHYRHHDFLFSFSDHIAHFGLEHHESSDNRVRERALIDGYFPASGAGLLTHEFVHSWNGKFRRPLGLVTSDYQQPMKDELLWVYEGLTTYLGEVLAARSGLYTVDEFRQHLAISAAEMENNTGRQWRPLIDTAIASPILLQREQRWMAWRRSSDYYEESELIWLEADVLIRQQTQGRRSLDDFCHSFFGGPNNGPELKPYTFDDVVNSLNQVAAYDWRKFFMDRIYTIHPHAPLDGIENAGWKLVYDETPGYIMQGDEQVRRRLDLRYSVGFRVRTDTAVIEDVTPGFPAFAAGLGPGMRVVSVNGREFSSAAIDAAITAAKSSSEPIVITAQNGEFIDTYRIDYHDGEKYPSLRRDDSKRDVLSDIIKPHAGTSAER